MSHTSLWYMVGCTIARSRVHVREYGIRVSSTWWDVPYSPFPFQSGIRQSTSSWYSIMSLVHVQEPPNPISTILWGIFDMYVYSVQNMWVAQCTCTYMYVVCDPEVLGEVHAP